MWRLFRKKPKLVAEMCLHVCVFFVCVGVWQTETESRVVPAGICNSASIICSSFNQLPPSYLSVSFFPPVPFLSFLPRVKLAPLKDYNTVPNHHMLSVPVWMHACVCTSTCMCTYLFCLFPYLMPPVACSQSMSAFERQKQKQRRAERGHQVH